MNLREMSEDLKSTEYVRVAKVGDFSVSSDISELQVGGKRIDLDEIALNALCSYLGVNFAYAKKCPDDLLKENLDYWIEEYEDSEVKLRFFKNELQKIYSSSRDVLLVRTALDHVTRKFGEGEVLSLDLGREKTVIDALPFGDVEVADGRYKLGMRYTVNTAKNSVSYAEALFVGSKGTEGDFVAPVFGGRIPSKGMTIEDIQTSFLVATSQCRVDKPEMNLRMKEIAEEEVCHPLVVVQSLVDTSSLSKSAKKKVYANTVASLPEEPTYLDITKEFAETASNMTKSKTGLQELAGRVYAGSRPHVCETCNQTIDPRVEGLSREETPAE